MGTHWNWLCNNITQTPNIWPKFISFIIFSLSLQKTSSSLFWAVRFWDFRKLMRIIWPYSDSSHTGRQENAILRYKDHHVNSSTKTPCWWKEKLKLVFTLEWNQIGLHSGVVVSTLVQNLVELFSCGVCVISSCMCGFSTVPEQPSWVHPCP